MLKKTPRWQQTLCFFLIIVVLYFSVLYAGASFGLFPFDITKCQQPSQGTCQNQTTYSIYLWVIRYVFRAINFYSGSLTAIATIVIGVFTATLWRATNAQSKMTRESIELAREEFIASHRPTVKVRRIILRFADAATETGQFSFALRNIGSSKCKVVKITPYMACTSTNGDVFWPPQINRPQTVSAFIEAGYGHEISMIIERSVTEFFWGEKTMLDAVAGVQRELILRLTINYEDSMGNMKETSVCREYDFDGKRFRLVNDPEFEYED